MNGAGLSPVLYVEDEEDDVLLVKLAFKQAQIEHPLVVAETGMQAVNYIFGAGRCPDRVRHPLPCLVLLDLNLPQMSGFEVLQQIRRDVGLNDMPVIIFSSSSQESDEQKARELGANDYIVKPSTRALLADFARTLKRSWLSRQNGVEDRAV
jgi:CheY-like chemotaxis protein